MKLKTLLFIILLSGLAAADAPTISGCLVNATNVTAGYMLYVNATTTNTTDGLSKFWITLNTTASSTVAATIGVSELTFNTTGFDGTYNITCHVNDTLNVLSNSSASGLVQIRDTSSSLSAWSIHIIYMVLATALFFTILSFKIKKQPALYAIAALLWYILGGSISNIEYLGYGATNILTYNYFGREYYVLFPLFSGISSILFVYTLYVAYTNLQKERQLK